MKTKTTNENMVNNGNHTPRNLNYLKSELQKLENERFENTEDFFKSYELFKLIEKEGLEYSITKDNSRELFLDSPRITILKDEHPLLIFIGNNRGYELILKEYYDYDKCEHSLNPIENPYSNITFKCNDHPLFIYDDKLPNYNMSLEENIESLKFKFEWNTNRKEKLRVKFLNLYEEIITDYFKPLRVLRDEIIELEKIMISNSKTNKETQIKNWLNGVDKVEIKGTPDIKKFRNDDYDVIGIEKILEIRGFHTKYKGSNDKGHKERVLFNVGNIIKMSKTKYFVQTDDENMLFTTKNLTELLSLIYDWNEKKYFKELGRINKKLNKKYGVENPTDFDFDDLIEVNENHLVSTDSD